MRKHRVAAAAALLIGAGSLSAPVVAEADTTTTFYVNNASSANCSDSTTDSATTPYCTIQSAVNAATAPGDTVIVAKGTYAPFTVTASGTAVAPITIEGTTTSIKSTSTFVEATGPSTTPAVTLSGASYVNLKEFRFTQSAANTTVSISGSTHVSLDSSYVFGIAATTSPVVSISANSSYVTLSRNSIRGTSTAAVVATDGGSNDVITTNIVAGGARGPVISLDQTTASDVASNTISFGCGADIAVANGSTSASVENNILSLVEPMNGPCRAAAGTSAALQVDSSSVSGTIADFNQVNPVIAGVADYAWAGNYYTTTAAFTSATGQGVHDQSASPINSANSDAPGELSTDIWGNPRVDDPEVAETGAGTYSDYDRGAVQTVDPLQESLAANWPTKAPVSGHGTYALTITDPWGNTVTGCTYDFGDGTPTVTVTPVNGVCSTQHIYSATGPYPVGLALSVSDGATVPYGTAVTVDSVSPFTPDLTFSTDGARGVSATTANSTDDWNIVSTTYDFGDSTTPTSTNGAQYADHTYATPGTYTVKITETDAGGNQATTSQSFTTSGSYYTPVTPIRVLDTRKPVGVPKIARVAANGTVRLKIAGVAGVPSGVTAVTLNVTVTGPSQSGDVVVYPDGGSVPVASNLNFSPGLTVANTVVVAVGSDGYVDLTNQNAGTTDLVADLEGYYSTNGTSGYQTIAPTRLIDTRNTKTPVAPGATLRLNLGSHATASAVILNLTATGPTVGGYVTAYPDGVVSPGTSNVNFSTGETIANETVVQVGSDGYVDFTNHSKGTVNLVIDLSGYYTTGSGMAFVPITPTRFLDTRAGTGVVVGNDNYDPFYGHETRDVMIANVCPVRTCVGASVVPYGAAAIAANVTVTAPTGGGFVEAYPDDVSTAPIASLVNYSPGQTTPNATTVGLGAVNGGINLYNGGLGNVQLIVDVSGYYS